MIKNIYAGIDVGFRDDTVVLAGIPYTDKEGVRLFYIIYGYKVNKTYNKEIIEKVRNDFATYYADFTPFKLYMPPDAKQVRRTSPDTDWSQWEESRIFKSIDDTQHHKVGNRIRRFQEYRERMIITPQFENCESYQEIMEDFNNASYKLGDGMEESIKKDAHTHSFDSLSYLITSVFNDDSAFPKHARWENTGQSALDKFINEDVETDDSGLTWDNPDPIPDTMWKQ